MKERQAMLKTDKTADNGKYIFVLEGRLDTNSAEKMEAELQPCMSDAKELIFDFEKLQYISSAGLRILLSAQKTMNRQGTMKILHVNETIMNIFEVTGFTDILTIE